jgi:biopolymer transport protein ExbD
MEIKKKALLQIIGSSYAGVTDQTSLLELYKSYMSKDFSNVQLFADHECVKIIAEDKITYETVVGVMDAARGASVDGNHVTMFPNVTIAGGIIQ